MPQSGRSPAAEPQLRTKVRRNRPQDGLGCAPADLPHKLSLVKMRTAAGRHSRTPGTQHDCSGDAMLHNRGFLPKKTRDSSPEKLALPGRRPLIIS